MLQNLLSERNWEGFEKLVNDYFGNITIADLVNSNVGIDSYII